MAESDVPLKEHFEVQLRDLKELLTSEVANLKEATKLAHAQAETAIAKASTEATERLASHNGLIGKMEVQQERFPERESTDRRFAALEDFRSKTVGALALLSFIGVANLVKVWTE
jgi:hypothetical protein